MDTILRLAPGPANMPPALAKRVYEELAKAVKLPAVTENLSAQRMEVRGDPPDQLDALVRKEIPHWAKVIKDNNIKSGDKAGATSPKKEEPGR